MAEKTVEQLQREVLEVQLRRESAALEDTVEQLNDRKIRKERSAKTNAQRQAQMSADNKAAKQIEKSCRHKSGGNPQNILRGGGKFSFSILTRVLMPDGKTELIQCQRCRLKLYGRERTPAEERKMRAAADRAEQVSEAKRSLEEKKAIAAWEDHQEWKRLREISIEEGIDDSFMRGPTFNFQNEEGMSVIPEVAGRSFSGLNS